MFFHHSLFVSISSPPSDHTHTHTHTAVNVCTTETVTNVAVQTQQGISIKAKVVGEKFSLFDGSKFQSVNYVLGANLGASGMLGCLRVFVWLRFLCVSVFV